MQGKSINGFTLQRLLGVGGMAEVWYAENKIGRMAAVKMLLPKLCQDDSVTYRFITEAKVMVELSHPNIRQVYDYGDIDGTPAIVMEYLEGDDLKARMKRGQRFTDEELKRWWDQLVSALNYTHAKGIVHRDIKPSNIFIDKQGNVKLLDFGIAKNNEGGSGTMTGSTLGTRIYMSPEQVKDPKRVGPATDAYSLAVSFLHLLSGKAPYDSTTSSDYEIQVSIVNQPLDLSGLTPFWYATLTPYLEKDASKRPALKPVGDANKETATSAPDDDSTYVESTKSTPVQSTPNPMPKFEGVTPKRKSNLVPWIIAGAACVAAILMVLLGGSGNSSSSNTHNSANVSVEADENGVIQEDYSFDEIGAKVFAESGYLLSGQTYHAQAMVTAWQNTQAKAYVKLDGGAEKEYTSDGQGVINLNFNCGVGQHKYTGYIKMLDPSTGELKDFPFENSFVVAPPAVSVSATKMNVVYRGIDNPIVVGGGVGGEINVTASSGTLTRTGNGTYNLRPDEANEVTISVTSAGSSLGSMKFRVKDLPKPMAIIRNVVNGQVSKSALLAANRVEAEMKDFDFDGVHYDVVGYTFLYNTKSGITKEVKATSGTFNDEIKIVISKSNVGDMFVFTAIQVRGNDGKTKTIETPIGVRIK